MKHRELLVSMLAFSFSSSCRAFLGQRFQRNLVHGLVSLSHKETKVVVQDDPVGREGMVMVRQTQRSPRIDEEHIERVLRKILELTGCIHMDVGVWLASDVAVRKLNSQYRGKKKSTDILSFPFHEDACALDGDFPGGLEFLEATADAACDSFGGGGGFGEDITDAMNLGDMVLSVSYIKRAMARDFKDAQSVGHEAWAEEALDLGGASGAMMAYVRAVGDDSGGGDSAGSAEGGTAENLGGAGMADANDKGDDGNVAWKACLDARVTLLLVHGVLHLLGHDHEPHDGDDDDDDDDAANLKHDRVQAMYLLMRGEEEAVIGGLRESGLLLPAPPTQF
mmetsp:Transcript_80305/g.157020  ORF Transcript_80305/g.157020 Transcript_80305/m.157020 type:complete len:337 (+) Transcript_80305:79-1089(+)